MSPTPAITGAGTTSAPRSRRSSASRRRSGARTRGCGLSRLHPDDASACSRSEAATSPTAAPTPAPTEYRMLHRDGHVVWIRDDAVLVRDGDGRRALARGAVRHHRAEAGRGASSSSAPPSRRRWPGSASTRSRAPHRRADAGGGRRRGRAPRRRGGRRARARARARTVWSCAPAIGWPDATIGDTRSPPARRRRPATRSSPRARWSSPTGRPSAASAARRCSPSSARAAALIGADRGPRGPFGVLGVQSHAAARLQRRRRRLPAGAGQRARRRARAPGDRGPDPPPRAARPAHRAAQPGAVPRPARAGARAPAPRRDSLAAVLFLDLDRFKLVNDSLGHQVGDELLAAAAPRLSRRCAPSDTVARFGGDEFGILLEDIADEHDAIEMAERIAAVFTRPFVLAGSEHFVTTSIGIALAARRRAAPTS